MSHLYRGQWEWIDDGEFRNWRAPGGNAIDHFELRNWPQMGMDGPTEQGHAIFVYESPQTHPNLQQYLGDSLTGLIRADERRSLATAIGIGEAIVGTNMLEILLELLNQHADPSGLTRWKPIRGSQTSGFTFTVGRLSKGGFGEVINEPFDDTHPFWAPTLGIWQADYRRNRADVDAGLLSLDSLRGFTGASMRKYKTREDVLLPPEHLSDGSRTPKSTVSDDFNRGNEDPITGWDEVNGITWKIVSEEIEVEELVSAGYPASARFQTAVDSDDHEVEVTYKATDAAAGWMGPACRFAAAAETFYFAFIRESGGIRRIDKNITGTPTTIANDTGGAGPEQLIRLRHDSADLLQLFDDDVSVLSVSSETSITGNLRGGMNAHHSQTKVSGDDWSMTDLAAALTAAEMMAAMQQPVTQMGQVQQAVPI